MPTPTNCVEAILSVTEEISPRPCSSSPPSSFLKIYLCTLPSFWMTKFHNSKYQWTYSLLRGSFCTKNRFYSPAKTYTLKWLCQFLWLEVIVFSYLSIFLTMEKRTCKFRLRLRLDTKMKVVHQKFTKKIFRCQVRVSNKFQYLSQHLEKVLARILRVKFRYRLS